MVTWQMLFAMGQFIMFDTKQQLAKISHIEVRKGNEVIAPVEFVWNLGFYMDCLLKNTYNVNKICAQLYSNLWDLRSIRTYINTETVKIIIQTIILSKL